MAVVEVLKWDNAPNVFAFKYPGVVLNTKAQIIVSESQEAVLVKEGRFYGPLGSGRHVLDTKNYPFLSPLVASAVTGGRTAFTADVWFTQKAIPLDVKWGTSDPIQVEDPKYHIMLPVRAFGQYGLQIVNSQKFLAKLVGQLPVFVTKTLSAYFKGIIITRAKDCIGSCLIEQDISVLQIAGKLSAISEKLQQQISNDLDDYGLRVVSFMVNSISTDEEDSAVSRLKEALARKAEMDIIGYTYQQKRSFDTMETAAGNQGAGGNLMNVGMGLGMGVGIGAPMGNMMGSIGQNLQLPQSVVCPKCGKKNDTDSAFCPGCGACLKTTTKAEAGSIECGNCGFKNSLGTKFCSNCGAQFHICPSCGTDNPPEARICRKCGDPLPKKCPVCGALIAGEVNFCNECGAPLQKKCPGCGNPVEMGIKFCPECGTKLI